MYILICLLFVRKCVCRCVCVCVSVYVRVYIYKGYYGSTLYYTRNRLCMTVQCTLQYLADSEIHPCIVTILPQLL